MERAQAAAPLVSTPQVATPQAKPRTPLTPISLVRPRTLPLYEELPPGWAMRRSGTFAGYLVLTPPEGRRVYARIDTKRGCLHLRW